MCGQVDDPTQYEMETVQMTRKDFTLIAYALRNSKPHPADDDTGWRYLQWGATVIEMMRQLETTNTRFDGDAFKVACGYTVRPDGAMWAINWETGRIAK